MREKIPVRFPRRARGASRRREVSAYPDRRASSHLAEAYSLSPRSFGARSFVNTLVKSSRRVQTTLPLTNYWRFIHPQDAGTTRSVLETMGTEDREAGIVPPDVTTSKVKGKRSKLNQRKVHGRCGQNEHVLRLDETRRWRGAAALLRCGSAWHESRGFNAAAGLGLAHPPLGLRDGA